jgi:hypothetical protein
MSNVNYSLLHAIAGDDGRTLPTRTDGPELLPITDDRLHF